MAGGGTISTTATKLEALRLQSSTYGATLPVLFGRTRVPGNVLWYNGFQAIKETTKKRAGKGGGTTIKTVTYSYTANIAMGICEGQILGIPRVWRGKDQFSGGIASSQIVTTSENYAVPGGGGSKVVANASGWRCTVQVSYTGTIDVGDGTTSGPIYLAEGVDYTVAAGTYTFGAQWAGITVSIEYQYLTGSLTQAGLVKAGLTQFAGAIGQATWSVLTSEFPAQAIPYSGIAFVAGQDYWLTTEASLPNHSFEVQAPLAYHLGASVPDVDPSMVALALLTDGRYGALFPAGRLNLLLWSKYCRAAGLLLSPALTEQLSAAELVDRLAQYTNTAPVWSAGALKMIPYGDQALTGNGATYTPNVTPLYDLDDQVFLPRSDGGEPVSATLKARADSKNHIRIEYLDRTHDYNISIAEAKDQADIDVNGLRSTDIVQAHWICDGAIAAKIARLLLQRSLYVRTQYEFKLPWTFALIEPMDLLTITDSYLGLDQEPVRVIEISESEDGELEVTAEEFPAGVATASLYGSQTGGGYNANFNADPGAVLAPRIFEAPAELTTTGLEVYAAVIGAGTDWGGCSVWVSLDQVSYYNAGVVYGGARYGALTGAIAGGNLPVQLNAGETIVSASAADAAALTSLCYIGGSSPEYLAHGGATLTGPGAYTLAGLVRGGYGTLVTPHATNDPFVRVDDGVGKSGPLSLDMVGKTIYFKFTSFNIYGGSEQDLADVTEYSYVVTGYMAERARAIYYYIKPVNGSALKNGVGSLTLEARVKIGQSDYLLPSGSALTWDELVDQAGDTMVDETGDLLMVTLVGGTQLYVGTTLVTTANGFGAGSDGYTGVFESNDIAGSVVVTLKDGAGGEALDSLTLMDVFDGADGFDGAVGTAGYTLVLSNVAAAIQCDLGGTPKSGAFDIAVGQCTLWHGDIDVTSSATFSSSTSGVTGSVNTTAGTPVTGAKGSYRITAMSAAVGYLEISAVIGGATLKGRLSVSKVLAGSGAQSATQSLNNLTVTVTSYPTTGQGGPLTLSVGPNGTIHTSFDWSYEPENTGDTLDHDAKVQYREVGAGTWLDYTSAEADGALVEYPDGGYISKSDVTMNGPTTAKQYEFQWVAKKSGNSTVNSLPMGNFSVWWTG